MSENRYPGDPMQDLRDLQRAMGEQQATQQRQPLTEATLGWILHNMATPSAAAAGCHIFASGGQPYAVDSSGVVWSMRHRRGAAVSDPSVSVSSAPASYDQSHIQSLVNAVQSLNTAVVALITSLENSDQISS
ncbi:hypothetical protein HS041_12390 [Planomonospora sp. ID67723]|uniref:hypothetical protein n=1 Tax=Planomonospora sp. ID67723 TaxID=2738134 RepID=UPI0018C431D8|nr:hypothetical protein [Planomonospora sp. ID67723]MBG0828568.1 hypothetical protein [Planomonospora sp. ID67723]